MGEDTSQIEREIRNEREELGRNLDDLEQKAKELADWRKHYARHPEIFLGAAVGLGLLVGTLTAASSPDGERAPRDLTSGRPLRERSQKVAHLANSWGHISNALLGLATAKVIDAIAQHLPGFRDEYDRHAASADFSHVERVAQTH